MAANGFISERQMLDPASFEISVSVPWLDLWRMAGKGAGHQKRGVVQANETDMNTIETKNFLNWL